MKKIFAMKLKVENIKSIISSHFFTSLWVVPIMHDLEGFSVEWTLKIASFIIANFTNKRVHYPNLKHLKIHKNYEISSSIIWQHLLRHTRAFNILKNL